MTFNPRKTISPERKARSLLAYLRAVRSGNCFTSKPYVYTKGELKKQAESKIRMAEFMKEYELNIVKNASKRTQIVNFFTGHLESLINFFNLFSKSYV